MTTDDNEPLRPSLLRFRLLGLILFVSVVALWLSMWRAVGVEGILFVTVCIPFGLLVYTSAKRCGHPMLTGPLTGLALGILGTFVVYGWLDSHPLEIGDFAHLTTTGLAVGSACGAIAWIKSRRKGLPRQ